MVENRLSFVLVSAFLTLSIGGWILVAALDRTVGSPEQTKQLIAESGVYEAVVPAKIAETQRSNPSLANVPLQNTEVQRLLGQSLDAQNLRTQGDKAIDAVYSWLEGSSDQPRISFDVITDQKRLSATLSDYAATRAATLPQCVPGVDDYSGFASDPISAKCLPPGVSPDTVRTYVTQAIEGNPALAANSRLTEDDVTLANGKTILDSFSTAPVWYQRAQLLPLILGAAAVIFALLLLLVLGPLGGMRSAGKHLLSVGITLAICAVLLAWGIEKLYSTFVPRSTNPNIGDALMDLTNLFNAALRDNILQLSLYVAAAGATLYVVAFVLGKLPRFAHLRPAARSARPVAEPSATSLASRPVAVSFTPIAAAAAAAKAVRKTAPSLPKKKAPKKPAKKLAAKKSAKPAAKKPGARKKKK